MEIGITGTHKKEGSMTDVVSKPIFGVAGFPPAFFKSEYKKKRENIFAWLRSIDLDWVELQCTYGVKMKDDQALLYKRLADENNIGISLHAPYFITLASNKNEVVKNSKERILQCFALADKINSKRIIFHPGHFTNNADDSRKTAIKKIVNGLNELKNDVPDGINIFPETAGKRSQIGSVEEILDICEQVSYARPCIDVAHVHGFERGCLKTPESIIDILNIIEKRLGAEYLKQTHFHMYPVEIDNNGEKKHKAFHDRIEEKQNDFFESPADRYYPLAEDFITAIKAKDIKPVIICEARDSQEQGARLMSSIYNEEDFL